MKKLLIVLALFAAAMVLGSCSKETGGGTIEITNNYSQTVEGVTIQFPIKVSIVKSLIPDTKPTEEIGKGETRSFSFDEDGTYTVYAAWGVVPLLGLGEKVSLSGNGTVKITVGK
ncbi:MAG: hypothetical protein LBG95_03670 [Treponema sp.]|nr:hypothetical protein [Treponema sp.]